MGPVETSEGRGQDYIKNKKNPKQEKCLVLYSVLSLAMKTITKARRWSSCGRLSLVWCFGIYPIVYDEDDDCVYYN